MQALKKAAPYAGIFVFSILLFLLWGGFDPEMCIVDDNRTQWFPVMEHAYNDFFTSGRISVYDFFQFKGFSVAEQGYYSVMNPLMLLCYVLTHYTPIPLKALTLYTALLFSVGNICFYALCRELKCRLAEALLLTGGYCGISAFTAFFFWYYVYNNYFCIPLLILIFLRGRGKKWEYCGCGLLLAFEIMLGNVQYTFYHYMIFGILCLIYLFLDSKRYIGVLLSNALCGGILSAPFLLLLLRASGGFQNNEFLAQNLEIADITLGSLLPMGIINRYIPVLPRLFNTVMRRSDFTWLYNGTFAVFWIAVTIYLVCRWSRSLKQRNRSNDKAITINGLFLRKLYQTKIVQADGSHLIMIGLTAVLLFFILFETRSVLAYILRCIPIIKNFRYLFKCHFVAAPVFGILTAAVLPHIRSRLHRSVPVVLAIVTVIGLVNNAGSYQIARQVYLNEDTPSISEEIAISREQMQTHMPDLSTYRSVTLMMRDEYKPDVFRCYNGFLRNFATTMGVYSLCGYEVSLPVSKLKSVDCIYRLNNTFAVSLLGCSVSSTLLSNLESNPVRTREQLYANGVRYLLVEKNFGDSCFQLYKNPGWEILWEPDPTLVNDEKKNYPLKVTEALEKNGIAVAGRTELNEYFDIIELSDPSGICTSEHNTAIPLNSTRMDELCFASDGSQCFRLAFFYDKHLTARITAPDGSITPLELSPDENNDILVKNPEHYKGTVTITYHDTLCTIGFVFEALLSVLFLVLLIQLCRKNSEK